MALAVPEPASMYHRMALNRRRTVLLLAAASGVWLPFGAGLSYGVVRAAVVLTHPGASAATPLLLVAALTAVALAIPWLLFLRLASSPLRTLELCGPLSLRTPAQEAREILDNLARDAGLPAPRLYVLDALSPNALAAGVKPSHAIVVVTRGLLELLERRELAGVLAHEFSRIANHDTRWDTAVAAIGIFLRLPSRLLYGSARRRKANPYDLLLLPLVPAILLAAPLLAPLLQAAVSRYRIPPGDADAAALTHDPEGLMRALGKIWGCGPQMPKADPVVAHFCFADPVPAGPEGMFRGRLLKVHPPVKDRLEALGELAKDVEVADMEAAAASGKDFADAHAVWVDRELEVQGNQSSDLVFVGEGNRSCAAQRVAGPASDVYESENPHSPVVAHVAPGDLVIAFPTASDFQQVVTSAGAFGFLPRTVKLERTDRLPPDVFLGVAESQPDKPRPRELTKREMIMAAAAFGMVVFAAVVAVLSSVR